jgi:hypothetical protein
VIIIKLHCLKTTQLVKDILLVGFALLFNAGLEARAGETRLSGRSVIDSVITVLVLPPYDEIANAGVSPDTRVALEEALAGDPTMKVKPFPFRELMNVPYQMVYDKKYCTPILRKVKCDVIVMTRIISDDPRNSGRSLWSYTVKVFNTRSGRQVESISARGLEYNEVVSDIAAKAGKLSIDILETLR